MPTSWWYKSSLGHSEGSGFSPLTLLKQLVAQMKQGQREIIFAIWWQHCWASVLPPTARWEKKDATFSRDYYFPLITWDTELLCTHNTIPCLHLKSGFRFSCPSTKTWLPFPLFVPSQVSQGSDATRELHVTGELPISALGRKFQFPHRCSLRIFMMPPCSSNSILHLL